MELHKAIQQIIKAHGLSTLQEPRLLNMLNDYQAYKSNPATKFVVSSLFNEGVIALLMNYGQWNTQCDQLVNQVSKTTGFQSHLVAVVLKSFAFGLGWIKESDIQSSPNNPNPPAPNPNPNPPGPGNPNPLPSGANGLQLTYAKLKKQNDGLIVDYIDRSVKYLNRLIEIKGDWRQSLGVKVSASCSYEINKYDFNDSNSITVHVELDGRMKYSNITIKFVLYSHQNIILASNESYVERSKNDFQVVDSTYFNVDRFMYVGNVGRIVIYWDKN